MKFIRMIIASTDAATRGVFQVFGVDSYLSFERSGFSIERRSGQLLLWFGCGQLFLSKASLTK